MWCTQSFAFIADGEVKNVVVCDSYEAACGIAKSIYGENATAEDVTQYSVQTGDKFNKGKFIRDDEEIKPIPTIEERLNNLNASATDLEEAACDLSTVYEDRIAALEEAVKELTALVKKGDK